MAAPDEPFDGAPLLYGETVLDAGHGRVSAASLRATAYGVFEELCGHRSGSPR
jgi:alpha-L-rhamnosidase